MDNSKILLIKLSPQFEEASRLIGTVIIGKLLMTAFSRIDTPEERRRPFNLYVDEVQRFQSSDFATFISEARKWNIATHISHQVLTQLLEQNRASALASGTIICFRVSGQDAPVLARSYDTTPTQPHIVGEEPIRAPVTDVVGHLTRRGHTNPVVAQFVADYLLPLETLVRNVSSFHRPFEFGCLIMRNIHVTGGRQFLNDCLFEAMRTGKADLFIQPLALLVLGGAVDDGVTEIFDKFQKYEIFRPQEFPGLDASANYFGHPSFLDDPRVEEVILKKYAKKRYYDDVFRSRIVTPGPSFIRMLRALRETMAILSREPILVDTGQYRPRLQPRLFSDMAGEIARDLTNAPNYQAKVKIVSSGEYVIRTKPAPQTLSGTALAERIEAVKRHCRALGYSRHYSEVIEEIRTRQERWRRDTGTAKPQPPDGRDRPQEPPPPALF